MIYCKILNFLPENLEIGKLYLPLLSKNIKQSIINDNKTAKIYNKNNAAALIKQL